MTALLQAPWIIQLHTYCALLSILIGAAQFMRKKGGSSHRLLGRTWVGLMAIVALSSFAIFEIRLFGPFSPIHLLSLLTLGTLVVAIQAARAGNIQRHKQALASLYGFGLVLAGAFTLVPGRILHQVLFG